MNKMKPDYKKQWVEALRSDKYAQGRKYLVRDDGPFREYCCLGVLCDILPDDHSPELIPFAEGDLTLETETQVGLEHETMKKLAYLNDNGKSFKWIAGYIERYL